jgi:hypothetical protein
MDPAAHTQFRLALGSLPWYVVGTFLFGPALLAPFTAFASLAWYVALLALFSTNITQVAGAAGMIVVPGLFLWILRQFVRAAVYSYVANRQTGARCVGRPNPF